MSKNQPAEAPARPAYKPQEQHDGRGPNWREDQKIKEQQQTEQQQQMGVNTAQADDAQRTTGRAAQFGTYAAGKSTKQQGDDTWAPGSRDKKCDSIERARSTEDRGHSLQMG